MPCTTTVARRVTIAGMVWAALISAGSAAARGGPPGQGPGAIECHGAGSPAIRTNFSFVDQLLQAGISRSPTFAAEAQELATSDLVVFVEPVQRMPADMNAYLMFMSATQACRFVRVRYDIHLTDPRAIAIIGHELQHALEIASHPEVIDNASLIAMYERYGYQGRGRDVYDSAEAVEAGLTILRELLNPAAANADDAVIVR